MFASLLAGPCRAPDKPNNDHLGRSASGRPAGGAKVRAAGWRGRRDLELGEGGGGGATSGSSSLISATIILRPAGFRS